MNVINGFVVRGYYLLLCHLFYGNFGGIYFRGGWKEREAKQFSIFITNFTQHCSLKMGETLEKKSLPLKNQ